MFCEKCGSQLNENDSFCNNCGAPIEKKEKTSGFSLDMLKYDPKKSNLIALVSCAVMIIMTFLPYAVVQAFGMSASEPLIKGDGIFFIIIALCGAAVALMGHKKGLMIIGGIACGLTLIEIITFSNAANELGMFSSMVKTGIGFWLMILSSAGLLASPFVVKYISKGE